FNPMAMITQWVGAVALAMLVGRLDSTLIGAPRAVIIVLYSYVVVGANYVRDLDPATESALIVGVFLCKTLMILVVEWILTEGILQFSLIRMRQNLMEAGSVRTNEIAAWPYTHIQLIEMLVRWKRLIGPRSLVALTLGRDEAESGDIVDK